MLEKTYIKLSPMEKIWMAKRNEKIISWIKMTFDSGFIQGEIEDIYYSFVETDNIYKCTINIRKSFGVRCYGQYEEIENLVQVNYRLGIVSSSTSEKTILAEAEITSNFPLGETRGILKKWEEKEEIDKILENTKEFEEVVEEITKVFMQLVEKPHRVVIKSGV